MSNRTSAPWRVGDAGSTVFGPKSTDGTLPVIVASKCRAANARLIAAAPDLLEACKLAIEWAKDVPEPYREWPFIVAMRAAIAKAEGRA